MHVQSQGIAQEWFATQQQLLTGCESQHAVCREGLEWKRAHGMHTAQPVPQAKAPMKQMKISNMFSAPLKINEMDF